MVLYCCNHRNLLSLPYLKKDPSVRKQKREIGFMNMAPVKLKAHNYNMYIFRAGCTVGFVFKTQYSLVHFQMPKQLTEHLNSLNGILYCMKMLEEFL